MTERTRDTSDSEDSQETGEASQPRIRRRKLSRDERRSLDETAQPGAVYKEARWRKQAREDLRRIQRAVDELDSPGSTRRVRRGRRSSSRRLPAGLRTRITDALGSVAYVQLSYSTDKHHVCHAGLRTEDGIEDVIVLVGPDEVQRFDDVREAVDRIDAPEHEPGLPRVDEAGPFGRVYELEEIEGIGEVYRDELIELGLEDTRDLWQTDPEALADELDVSAKTTRRWRRMAELMAVSGIGPQYAELLVRSGVETIDALAQADAEDLVETIADKQKDLMVRIQGNVIKPGRAQGWIDAAREHAPDAREAA